MIRQDWSTLKKLMFAKTAAAGAAVTEATATGNPLTFVTDLARPLKSLLIPFTPQQEGSGDPSPSNIRSILPWNGLMVNRAGKNWFDENVNQSFTQYKRINLANPIPAGTYVFTATVEGTTESSYVSIAFAKEHNVLLAKENLNNHERGSVTFTVADEVNIIYLYADVGYSEGEGKDVKYSGILITSEAPTDTDIVFPSPVYGGTLDVVSGVLTVTHVCLEVKKRDFTQQGQGEMPYRQTPNNYIIQHRPKSGVNWNLARQTQKMECAVIANPYSETTFGNYIGVCIWDTNIPTSFRISIDVYNSMQNDDDSISICYEIADPFEIQLTPQQLTAIVGNNTIWSDADGSMTATYLKKG